MKIWTFLISFLLVHQLSFSTSYYVSSLDGDNSHTGGNEESAWLTIAHVSALSPGDTVNIEGEFRERLTVSDSGSVGCPITYQGYGTGGKINASNIYTGFTQRKLYTTWVADGESVFLDEDTVDDQIAIFNLATKIWHGQTTWTASESTTVTALEVNFSAKQGNPSFNVVAEIYTMNGTALGNLVGSTSDALACSTTGVKKFTGLDAYITADTTYALVIRREDSSFDAVNYFFVRIDDDPPGDTWSGNYAIFQSDKSRLANYTTYEFGVKLYKGGVSPYYATYTEQPTAMYYDDVLMTKNTVSLESLATGEWWDDTVNDRIYIYDDPTGHTVKALDTWNVGYTTEPNQVFFNDTLLNKNTITKASLATGQWYDDTVGSRIYLYDDPSSNTIEGSYWAMCINFNNKSYITVKDLEFTKSNGHNVWINTSAGRFDGLVVQGCTISYALNHGLAAGLSGFSTTGMGVSKGLKVLDNIFLYNGLQGAATEGNTGFAINISGNSPTDYIEDVLVQGNICIGDASGIKADWFSNDIIFEKNYLNVVGTPFSCDGGQNNTWRNNIINSTYADHTGYAFAIFRWEGDPGPPFGFAVSNNKILNNLVYGYKKGMSLRDDQTDTIVKNNIFYMNFSDNVPVWMEDGETRTGLVIDYNDYYTGSNAAVFTLGGTYNFAQWKAEGYDTHSIAVDPLFRNAAGGDFRPMNRQLWRAGTYTDIQFDKLGKRVNRTRPSIGSYETPHHIFE